MYTLIKLLGAEPDIFKMCRRGVFSLFYPWRALEHRRRQKQKLISAADILGAKQF